MLGALMNRDHQGGKKRLTEAKCFNELVLWLGETAQMCQQRRRKAPENSESPDFLLRTVNG